MFSLKEVSILTDVDVIIHNCRIENLSSIDVDLITSRALAPLNKLINYVEIFVNKSTKENDKPPKMLFLKGKSWKKEISELNKTKKIKYQEFPSLTDNYGRIIYIDKIDTLEI